ncbi:MAG: glycosyltransferase [Lachnospiraceae bacterium]|nr:glycosyltransferase [Lachnospiraceae bacterium]
MKYSVVIPCYNSALFLKTTVGKIQQIFNRMDYEIILVNDSSPDSTIDIITELVKDNKNIIGIDLAHNTGQHNATMAGFNYVSGDYVITCADDGQSPMEMWLEMIDALDDGYDVATVYYTERGKRSLFRRFGSKIATAFGEWLIDMPKQGGVAFELVAKRFVIDEMIRYQSPYASINGLVLRTTWNIKKFVCEQHSREVGKSGYTFKKLLKIFLNQSTAFSVRPLRLASAIGVLFACSGVVMGVVTIVRKLAGIINYPGFSSIAVILLIGFGLIMVMLGLIGEYVGRIYMVVNMTPQFVVRREIKNEELEPDACKMDSRNNMLIPSVEE